MNEHPAWRLSKGRVPDFLDDLGVPVAIPVETGGGEVDFRIRARGEVPAERY